MIVLFSILSVFCFLYFLMIVLYSGIGSSFVGFWFIASIGFAGMALAFYLNKTMKLFSKTPNFILFGLCGIIAAVFLLFFILVGCVISGMISKPQNKADYVIVLGAQIRGERITKSLAKRLDAALEYYNDNNNMVIIVSGGKGKGEDVTEASAMKKYLEDKGIPSDNILLEDKSSSTNENLKYSYEIICERGDEGSNVLVCSNNFHIFRAVKIAKHIGIENVEGLAAKSDNKLLLNYIVRDSFAIFKELLIGNIAFSD